ncbi:protein MFI isoform X4 [Phyllobates terribilis]|uniref:protein MFI isoform X4 n=1 Tax=Phyllobates terribilis TaxID=111132 RepID=UPI003CCAC2DC
MWNVAWPGIGNKAAGLQLSLLQFHVKSTVPNFYGALEVMMEDVSDPVTTDLVTSDPNIYTMEEDRAARVIQKSFRRILTRFPPNIYYKLFTHRPIVDMCANSPKDYTKQSVKQLLPGQIHNHGVILQQDHSGWYARVENNGWRLLTFRLFNGLDDVTLADNRIPFTHSKLQRKQEVLEKQKKRKIEWMRKMYYEGSLHAQTTEPNTAVLVQRATEGVIKSVEQHGAQAVLDWEVDELLNWTNALNYDEYISCWKAIGTSKSSCAFKGTTLVRSPYDVYEFSQMSSPALFSLTTSIEEAE